MKHIILSIVLISCLSSFISTGNLNKAGAKTVAVKKSTNDFTLYGKGDTDPYYFYQISLYNTTTSDEYLTGFSGDNVWTDLGTITEGVYNIVIYTSSDPGYRFYYAGCSTQAYGYYGTTYYGVTLDAFCNHITLN